MDEKYSVFCKCRIYVCITAYLRNNCHPSFIFVWLLVYVLKLQSLLLQLCFQNICMHKIYIYIYIILYKVVNISPHVYVEWLMLNYICLWIILTCMNFPALTSINVILSNNFSLILFSMWHVYVLCHIYYVKRIILFMNDLIKICFKCWEFIVHYA